MKVTAYIRVSTAGQVKDGLGLATQERLIKAWAKSGGHKIVAIRRDEGVSGANGIGDREGLPLALADIEDGQAEAIVVSSIDRLARVLHVQEAILGYIWKDGGKLYTVDGGEVDQDDPDDPMRKAMRKMAGVFAELDRDMVIKRLRNGRQTKASNGGYAGGAPPTACVPRARPWWRTTPSRSPSCGLRSCTPKAPACGRSSPHWTPKGSSRSAGPRPGASGTRPVSTASSPARPGNPPRA